MGVEIERKFLVNIPLWNQSKKTNGLLYRQGYLVNDKHKIVRVRETPSAGYITIKSANKGLTRLEYEYEIPAAEAKELIDHFAIGIISKYRYRVLVEESIWEVDEFLNENLGLVIAEIELDSEHASFTTPPWINAEVTSDIRYYNASLADFPFSKWTDK